MEREYSKYEEHCQYTGNLKTQLHQGFDLIGDCLNSGHIEITVRSHIHRVNHVLDERIGGIFDPKAPRRIHVSDCFVLVFGCVHKLAHNSLTPTVE